MKFLFPCDCLKVPLKSIKIVQRKCILLFTVQNVVRSRTVHVFNKRCVNLEGKKISIKRIQYKNCFAIIGGNRNDFTEISKTVFSRRLCQEH